MDFYNITYEIVQEKNCQLNYQTFLLSYCSTNNKILQYIENSRKKYLKYYLITYREANQKVKCETENFDIINSTGERN